MMPDFPRANEYAILKALAVLQYATNVQMQEYTGYKASSHVREASARLVDQQFTRSEKRIVGPAKGEHEKIYSLAEKGKQFLSAEGVIVSKGKRKPGPRIDHFQEHVLAITDLIVLLKRYCQTTGSSTSDLQHDLTLASSPVRLSDTTSVHPDLWTTIDMPHGGRSLWWEVDRGTERSPEQWKGKVGRIAAGYQRALLRFGADTMTVATVTTTAERAQRLAAWTQEALTAHPRLQQIFRFTIKERMADPVNFLEGRHWLTLAWTFDSLFEKPQSASPERSPFADREGPG